MPQPNYVYKFPQSEPSPLLHGVPSVSILQLPASASSSCRGDVVHEEEDLPYSVHVYRNVVYPPPQYRPAYSPPPAYNALPPPPPAYNPEVHRY
jgi:hypothetical protein